MSELSGYAKYLAKKIAERSGYSFEHVEAIAQEAKKDTCEKLKSGELSIEDILVEGEQFKDDLILGPFLERVKRVVELTKKLREE